MNPPPEAETSLVMGESTMAEQQTNGVPHAEREDGDPRLLQALIWIGIAGLSAGLALVLVRALVRRTPVDPTTERIQRLIDEANQLLRTLDEQRQNA
jgi:hypothetical protein